MGLNTSFIQCKDGASNSLTGVQRPLTSNVLTLLVRGGGTLCPPLRNIALNQVIWGPGPPKLIDFS